MNRIINWLSAHRLANAIILLVYFLAVVLPHKRFGTFLNNTVVGAMNIDNNTAEGRQAYNLLALGIASFILISVLFFFIKNTIGKANRNRIWACLLYTSDAADELTRAALLDVVSLILPISTIK